MEETCFYCNNLIEENTVFHAPFIHQNEHIEKAMCESCYHDWLQGIKV